MKYMKKKWYEDIEELCEDIVDTYESFEGNSPTVSVIAKFKEAKEIISNLCKLDYQICNILIENPEFDGYDDEYFIGLDNDEIFCTKLKKEKEYIKCNSDYIFVLNDCNSKLLEMIHAEYEVYEVSFDDDGFEFVFEENDDDFEYELECCDCCHDDMHGFTAHKNDEKGYSSVSFYSTEKINTEEVKDIMKILGL